MRIRHLKTRNSITCGAWNCPITPLLTPSTYNVTPIYYLKKNFLFLKEILVPEERLILDIMSIKLGG